MERMAVGSHVLLKTGRPNSTGPPKIFRAGGAMNRSALFTALALLTLTTFSFSGCSSSPGGGANVINVNPNIQPVCPNNVLCLDAGQQMGLAVAAKGGAIRVAQADAAHPEATGPGVTWAITSGPGSLLNPTATSVTFQAEPPPIAAPAMTTITATSTTNANTKGSVTITTNPTPTVMTTSLNPAPEFTPRLGRTAHRFRRIRP
jgi:hypothetical protein